ncbi:hypothetical protein AAHC03_016349 [Spirometra sp. Aus1]
MFSRIFDRFFGKREVRILMVGLDGAVKTTILCKLKLGLVYVVNSNNRERIVDAREKLHGRLNEDELHGAALLVFANKQDLPNAMQACEITHRLGLYALHEREWFVQATCATSGTGLYEGLDWLSNTLSSVKR